MKTPRVLLAALLALSCSASSTRAALEIGTARAVKNEVVGTVEAKEHKIREGDPVHQDEEIRTAKESEGEFVFQDDTKLAVGPDSAITLDKFVYDPSGKGGEIVIEATKGAFRFITGKSAKTAYKINTPVTTIGVRGTIFDGFVNDNGEIAVLLVEGEINVCATPGNCRRLNRRGFFYHIRRNGLISNPLKWDGSFFSGVDFGRAFPFVGRPLRIDPVARFRRADLLGGRMLRQGVQPLRKVPKVVPKVVPRIRRRLPRIRRPF
jgi:hypothetical protein